MNKIILYIYLLSLIFLTACVNTTHTIQKSTIKLKNLCPIQNQNTILVNQKVLYICKVWNNEFEHLKPEWYISNEFTKNILIEFRKENNHDSLFSTQCHIGKTIFPTQKIIDACESNYTELLQRNYEFISKKIIENQLIKEDLNRNHTSEYLIHILKNIYSTPESRQQYLKPILNEELNTYPKSKKLITYIEYHLNM